MKLRDIPEKGIIICHNKNQLISILEKFLELGVPDFIDVYGKYHEFDTSCIKDYKDRNIFFVQGGSAIINSTIYLMSESEVKYSDSKKFTYKEFIDKYVGPTLEDIEELILKKEKNEKIT